MNLSTQSSTKRIIRIADSYFNKVRPTYIENWPIDLYELSIPQAGFSIDKNEALALGSHIPSFKNRFGCDRLPIASIVSRLDEQLKQFHTGAFIRLGSRSGKDSIYARNHGLKVNTIDEAVKMITSQSERIAFDLQVAIQHNYSPYIFTRKWIDIPKWAEFRCFMRNRQLIGISQYDCKSLGHCPEILINATKIKFAIQVFFRKFRNIIHLDDVVFDVFINDCDFTINVKLLELNPFFVKTDACLFSWDDEDDFDESFRFFGTEKEMCRY